MRLTRRRVLLGLAALAAPVAAAPLAVGRPKGSEDEGARPLRIDATPVRAFEPRDPARRRFGALTFRSGLVLSSPDRRFGGFSALERPGDGSRLVALSDDATWLTATLAYREGRLTGLTDALLAPVLSATGRPLRDTRAYDTEGLTLAGGTAYVSVERVHQVLAFDFGRAGTAARARPLALPPALLPALRRLRSNRGLEALAHAVEGPLAGSLVALAEEDRDDAAIIPGFILSGPRTGQFKLARRDGYAATDAAFLPGGDLLVLERLAVLPFRVGMRIRRIPAAAIRPGASVDGEVLIEADLGYEIDNMEGLSVHRAADGRTVLTLISDDNFAFYQRTLLLEFALD